jgi:4-hydroxy-3-polyprenylbenzoate decarboxylase
MAKRQHGDRNIVVAVTGASGGPYALRLLDHLESAGVSIHLIASPMGRRLLADECGVKAIEPDSIIGRPCRRLTVYDYDDVGCRLASGSYPTCGMVICPCSSNTLGAVAAGLGNNLISRAAQVALKESRRLVIVHREMPVSAVDLENMLRLRRAGAVICPASPGFYLGPTSIDDLLDFVSGRVLDLLGIEHALRVRWEHSGDADRGEGDARAGGAEA